VSVFKKIGDSFDGFSHHAKSKVSKLKNRVTDKAKNLNERVKDGASSLSQKVSKKTREKLHSIDLGGTNSLTIGDLILGVDTKDYSFEAQRLLRTLANSNLDLGKAVEDIPADELSLSNFFNSDMYSPSSKLNSMASDLNLVTKINESLLQNPRKDRLSNRATSRDQIVEKSGLPNLGRYYKERVNILTESKNLLNFIKAHKVDPKNDLNITGKLVEELNITATKLDKLILSNLVMGTLYDNLPETLGSYKETYIDLFDNALLASSGTKQEKQNFSSFIGTLNDSISEKCTDFEVLSDDHSKYDKALDYLIQESDVEPEHPIYITQARTAIYSNLNKINNFVIDKLKDSLEAKNQGIINKLQTLSKYINSLNEAESKLIKEFKNTLTY
jgi:hypothetical protein